MARTHPTTAPVLSDGTVTVRAHRPEDVEGLVAMGSDPDTVRWTTVPQAYGPADATRWLGLVATAWERTTMWSWAIELADDDGRPRFAGNVDIRLGMPPDIGFALAPWARGRGTMQAAGRLVLAWALSEGGLPVVHWSTHVGHLSSWRVAHALGFAFDGARPKVTAHRGQLLDGWFAHVSAGDELTARTTWRRPVVLEGERVRLRPHRDDDLPRIVEGCSDPRTRHWLPTMPHPYTLEHARSFVVDCRLQESLGGKGTWAVADRVTDELVANVGLFQLDNPMCPGDCEVGYWAHPDARARGAVTEAVGLAVAHAFTPEADGGLGRHRVQLGASWGNTASRRVAEANGFELVGRFRQDGVLGDGTYEDGAWYDRLR
ncbi:MAG: GNAT family N-acetyltransferase [Acidimicrobiales bacterium]